MIGTGRKARMSLGRGARRIVVALVPVLAGCLLFRAVGRGESDEELAKQTQNPVANLISVPFQNNTNFGLYDDDRTQNVLNIQPVIPIDLTAGWMLITRTIAPLIYQPSPRGTGGDFGLSDINITAFVAPPQIGPLILGVGPIVELPTSVNDRVGPGKFGLGPSVVALTMQGPWVVGGLINNVFSLAGDTDTPYVNLMTLQPFVNYNIGKTGWYVVSAPILNANWRAPGGDVWTVPVGGGFGKVFTLVKQPLNASVQGYYNAARPDAGGVTTLRLQVQFLFPTG